jgi:general secretion pathway protein M
MKSVRLSSRLRCGAFLTSHVLVVVSIVFAGYAVVRSALEVRESEILSLMTNLQRIRSVIALKLSLTTSHAPSTAPREEFLAGADAGTLQADLQSRLKKIAEASGARPQTIAGVGPIGREQQGFITVNVRLVGTLKAVRNTLHGIETERPFLFVPNVTLKKALGTDPLPHQINEHTIEAEFNVAAALEPTRRAKK